VEKPYGTGMEILSGRKTEIKKLMQFDPKSFWLPKRSWQSWFR